jgi:hypothetical protein
MIVYSEKIVAFVREIKFILKKILIEEVKLKVHGDRFYDKSCKYSYPIKIVIFNSGAKLGYFNADFYELGFHESVFYSSKEQIENLIRHELAHYLTFLKYGEGFFPHGKEFLSICKELNWGKKIYQATTSLEQAPLLNKSSIARKIEKLIALGSSSNTYESTQAIIKSRELLLKHNIQESFEKEDKVFLKRILKQKKKNAKMEACGHILETFFVSTIYNYSNGYVYLEIIGNQVNIAIAEYIAGVLEFEMERLWKESGLKGLSEKNSFFSGIAKGYCKQMEDLKNKYEKETTNALLVLEKKLIDSKSLIYPHLSKVKSFRKHSKEASSLGEKIGKALQFKKGVAADKKSVRLIDFDSRKLIPS